LNKVFSTIGARTTAIQEREINDFYATDPKAIDLLLNVETFNKNIWEVACGMGHLSERLKQYNFNVKSSDLINRGYPETEIIDFLNNDTKFNGDIITNPPFKYTTEFILNSLDAIPEGNKVAMFLKLLHLEGIERFKKVYSKFPPKKIYILSKRLQCAKDGDFKNNKGGAIAYAWFVWQKGVYNSTKVDWIYF